VVIYAEYINHCNQFGFEVEPILTMAAMALFCAQGNNLLHDFISNYFIPAQTELTLAQNALTF
jgi:hypothetical protein